MNIPFVDLKKQYQNIKQEIDERIHEILDETTFVGGKYIDLFEKSFAQASGSNHCLGVACGTDALYISLKQLGIGKGDEVITTACSWISTSEVINRVGAKPVFVDIGEDHLINVDLVESKISSKTKAIIPVHLHGQMADISKIKELCDQYNLYMIEDCAQAHLAKREGIKAGTIGEAGAFSFYPSKNLGAFGDAGAIITNNKKLDISMRMFSRNGGLSKHEHTIEGINSKLDHLQAGVLEVKLKYLIKWTEKRQAIAQRYFEGLKNMQSVSLPKINPDTHHVFHLFVIVVEHRDKLKIFLEEKGVLTLIHYPVPLPLIECYQYMGYASDDFPVAYKMSQKVLSLPIFPELSMKEQDYVINCIHEFYSLHS